MTRQENAEQIYESLSDQVDPEDLQTLRKLAVRYATFKSREGWDESQVLEEMAELVGENVAELAKSTRGISNEEFL